MLHWFKKKILSEDKSGIPTLASFFNPRDLQKYIEANSGNLQPSLDAWAKEISNLNKKNFKKEGVAEYYACSSKISTTLQQLNAIVGKPSSNTVINALLPEIDKKISERMETLLPQGKNLSLLSLEDKSVLRSHFASNENLSKEIKEKCNAVINSKTPGM